MPDYCLGCSTYSRVSSPSCLAFPVSILALVFSGWLDYFPMRLTELKLRFVSRVRVVDIPSVSDQILIHSASATMCVCTDCAFTYVRTCMHVHSCTCVCELIV